MPREYPAAIKCELPARELLLASRPLTFLVEREYGEEGYVFDFFMDIQDNAAVTEIMKQHFCLGNKVMDLQQHNPDDYLYTLTLDSKCLDFDNDNIHFTRALAASFNLATDSLLPQFNFPTTHEGRLCEVSMSTREHKIPPQDSGYVMVVPGFNEFAWAPDRWQDFMEVFCRRTNLPVIMPTNIMTAREKDTFQGLCLLRPMQSIWELAWFVLNARAVFTVESWFVHFVAALNVPLVILGLRKDIRGFQYQHHAIQYLIGPPIHLRPEDVVSTAVKVSQIYDLMR